MNKIFLTALIGVSALFYSCKKDNPEVVDKTVAVGAQAGTLTMGVAGTITFPVTTTDIADGEYTAAVANLPAGVTVSGKITITADSGTLTLAGDGSAPAGEIDVLMLTIDGVTSAAFTITVEINFVYASSGISSGVNSVSETLTMVSDTKLNIDLTAPVEIDPIQKHKLKRIFTIDAVADEQTVSDIYFGDEYVFVSYRSSGQKYRGTVDVYSIKSTWSIERKARFSFDDANIHAVCYLSGRLLLACASEAKPAFIEQIVYDPSAGNDPELKGYAVVPASNLCGIAAASGKIMVLATAGTPGMYIFNSETMMQDHFVSLQNPVSMTPVSETGNVLVLQNTSPVSVAEVSSTGQIVSNVSSDINNAGQNKGFTMKDRLYIRSDNQMQIFNGDHSKLQLFSWQGGSSGTQNLAAGKNISVMNDWLIMLGNNGTNICLSGLRNRSEADVTEIYDVADAGQTLTLLASNENLAFIADQSGKMQILRRIPAGYPTIPVYEQDMGVLNNAIRATLGWGNNLTKFPNLKESETNHPALTIKTLAKTKIYVSIVFQDASLPNSIGYYTFNSSALPDGADKLAKTLLFPNTLTAYESGNTLILGDATGKPIEFEAGQEIGFYLIQYGWDSSANNGYGGVKTDNPTMYSHLRYNRNNYQQQIMFRLESQLPIFVGFEDKWQDETNGWDGDMNDIVIAISDNMDNNAITKIDLTNIKIPENN